MKRFMSGPLVLATLSAAFLGAACEEKKSDSSSPRPDASAGVDKYAMADPKLAKALQAAASASAGAESGPPRDGIFPTAVADQRHPKGTPTKVDVVAVGAEPRVSLLPTDPSRDTARSSAYGPAAMELGMQMGPRTAMPTIDVRLTLGPAKKDEGGPDWLVAEVKKALPSKEQLGQLPAGTDQEIATLEGTQVRLRVTSDGRESDLQMQMGRSTRAELDRLAQNAAEAVALATVALPDKPLGVGAQWIAESRAPLLGVDVVTYRAYHVKGIEGDRLKLTLDVKAYAATTDVPFQGVPKGSSLTQFVAEAGGEMELVRGECVARKADVQQRVVMVFEAPGAQAPPGQSAGQPQGNVLTAQFQSQSTFVRGEDLRAASKP